MTDAPSSVPGADDFVIDFDPAHGVLRTTVRSVLTDEAAKNIYQAVARIAPRGGPFAAITDLSQVVEFPISDETIRGLAANAPAIPLGVGPA
jgi:hypothetical protein